MPTKTTSPVLDLDTLTRIEQHELVAPLHTEQCTLNDRQRDLDARLAQERMTLQSTEPGTVQSRVAQRRVAALEDELQEVRDALQELQPRLTEAVSTARADLRPLANAEAIPALEAMESALVQLQTAQEALLGVDARLHRLGTGPALARLADAALPARVRAVQDVIRKLGR